MRNTYGITYCIAIILTCLLHFTSIAQNDTKASAETKATKQAATKHYSNFIKVNVTALAIKNYSIQYERLLTKHISLAVAYRTMPLFTLPFQHSILKLVGDGDPETTKTIEDFRLSNFAVTPEIRFYLSKKGYGRGFYFAPFYRYAFFKTSDVNIFYNTGNNTENSIKLSGKLTGNTGGFLLGVQKNLGKHIVLDTWIFGPHYGSGKGVLAGVSSKPLTQDEQDALKDELNSIDIPLTDKTVNVNANGASVKLDGPWAGFRTGISLGIKF